MLSIIYNGIKPNEYKFEYSVIDNNKVDYIDFSFDNQHAGTPFVKIESKDKKYVDKINVSEYASNGHIIFPLLAKTTAHKVIRVQLSFETSDTKWQTEVVEITLKNSVRAEEEIANNYPSVLADIERKSRYADKKVHNNIVITETHNREKGLVFNAPCRVLLTENCKKNSKNVLSRYLDKKQGNKITDITFGQGFVSIEDVIDNIFGTVEQTLNPKGAENQINQTINFHGSFKIESCERGGNKTFYTITKQDLSDDILASCHKLENALTGFALYRKVACVMRLQFKFVKDFQEVGGHRNYWKGTMSNLYLDCLVYAFRDDDYIYISPMVKRF